MAKSFVPDLLELRERGKTELSPVILLWSRASQGVALAQTEFPDEEDLLAALSEDFGSRLLNQLFLFGQPKPIAVLREKHGRVMRAPKEHVLEVSRAQYAELLRLVASESELDKRRRTLDRAQERRGKRVEEITREMDRLEDALELILVEPLLPPELRGLLPKKRFRSEADLRIVSERNIQNFQRIFAEIGPILMELERLERKLAMIARCKSKLGRLKARIDEVEPKTSSGVLPSPSSIQSETVRPEAVRQTPSVPGSRRPSVKEDLPVESPVPETPNVAQLSLSRVREAVALGNQEGALRLMIPAEGGARRQHERGWTVLLKELGFTGELVVAPEYESLIRGSAPILMPRSMHTHTGRWKASVTAPLFVIDFAYPNFLLRLHQTGKL